MGKIEVDRAKTADPLGRVVFPARDDGEAITLSLSTGRASRE